VAEEEDAPDVQPMVKSDDAEAAVPHTDVHKPIAPIENMISLSSHATRRWAEVTGYVVV
jgi:hypothetical protein